MLPIWEPCWCRAGYESSSRGKLIYYYSRCRTGIGFWIESTLFRLFIILIPFLHVNRLLGSLSIVQSFILIIWTLSISITLSSAREMSPEPSVLVQRHNVHFCRGMLLFLSALCSWILTALTFSFPILQKNKALSFKLVHSGTRFCSPTELFDPEPNNLHE